jgi:hypothetical protein
LESQLSFLETVADHKRSHTYAHQESSLLGHQSFSSQQQHTPGHSSQNIGIGCQPSYSLQDSTIGRQLSSSSPAAQQLSPEKLLNSLIDCDLDLNEVKMSGPEPHHTWGSQVISSSSAWPHLDMLDIFHSRQPGENNAHAHKRQQGLEAAQAHQRLHEVEAAHAHQRLHEVEPTHAHQRLHEVEPAHAHQRQQVMDTSPVHQRLQGVEPAHAHRRQHGLETGPVQQQLEGMEAAQAHQWSTVATTTTRLHSVIQRGPRSSQAKVKSALS